MATIISLHILSFHLGDDLLIGIGKTVPLAGDGGSRADLLFVAVYDYVTEFFVKLGSVAYASCLLTGNKRGA